MWQTAGMRNKAGECVPVVYVRRSPGAGTPSPRQKSIRGDVGSTGGGTRSPADDGSSSSPNFELEVDTTDGSKDLAGTGSAPNGRKPPPAPAKKKAQGTKGKGASPRPSPKKKGKTPGKGRVPKPKSKAKPRPRPKAKRPRRKQGVRPKRKHLPMRQVDAQRVTRRPRRGLRTQGEPELSRRLRLAAQLGCTAAAAVARGAQADRRSRPPTALLWLQPRTASAPRSTSPSAASPARSSATPARLTASASASSLPAPPARTPASARASWSRGSTRPAHAQRSWRRSAARMGKLITTSAWPPAQRPPPVALPPWVQARAAAKPRLRRRYRPRSRRPRQPKTVRAQETNQPLLGARLCRPLPKGQDGTLNTPPPFQCRVHLRYDAGAGVRQGRGMVL